jgi:hypothetical protein
MTSWMPSLVRLMLIEWKVDRAKKLEHRVIVSAVAHQAVTRSTA